MKNLAEIYTSADWEDAKQNFKRGNELIIFKYSSSCSISYFVEKSFDDWFNSLSDEVNLTVLKVNVIKSRHLSQMIAQELKIKHESPQAIWLDKNNNIKWYASHHGISGSELNGQLKRGLLKV